jgi:AcrR family transcriptional regulator
MSGPEMTVREVGRHAIRLSLARVAFTRFCLQGFARVTFDELATAAGVSRSTFLRHFRTKEDAVLFVFDPVGEVVAEALDAADGSPASNRLAEALQTAAAQLVRDTPELRDVMELIETTPELRVGLFAKQSAWIEAALPRALDADPDGDAVRGEARLAAGFACLIVALRRWSADDGGDSLESILARTLAAVR